MKNSVTLLKRPKLKSPFFIAAWPGMGEVALKAALFLKDKLKAEEFAVFNPENFFQPSGIEIYEQVITTAKLPQGKFYYYKNHLAKNDLIIFISESQPLFEKSYEYAKQIASFIKEFKVKLVFTFAAFPCPIEHTKNPGVWAAASHKALIEELKKLSARIMTTGHISGLNGLILGAFKEVGIPGICLLGEIPFYTIQIENPLASLAVLEVLTKIINIKVDYKELQDHISLVNEEIERLINFLKDPESQHKPIGIEEIEKIKDSLSAYTKIPESIKRKIEILFDEAKKDITKASELKRLLDYWNIYLDYEDRFLDLFRKSQSKNN